MVRNKSTFAKKASVFAAPEKILMLQRNKSFGSSPAGKTPVTSKSKRGTPKVNRSINNSKNTPKKRRLKPGTRALREIQKFQKSTNLLIPKLPFSRLVREILQSQPRAGDFRMSTMALMALQEAAEMAMVNMLEVANLCCIHAHRVTLDPRDIRLTRRAFGLGHPINH